MNRKAGFTRITKSMTLSLILFLIASDPLYLPIEAASVTGRPSTRQPVVGRDAGEELEYVRELWLEDFDTGTSVQREKYDVDHDVMMQADSPPITDEDRGHVSQPLMSAKKSLEVQRPECPPPPQTRPPHLCEVTTCDSDVVCTGRGLLCCYNGCKYTCMVALPPKSYIDWMGQPSKRLPSGSSWLVQGKEERTEVDWCSTTEIYYEDEEPVLCPQGHICHIDDLGDPNKGVPNRGRCVALESKSAEEMRRRYRIVTGVESIDDCPIGDKTYDNGSTFLYDKHICNCVDGSVLCKVGHRNKPAGDLT